MKGQLFIIPTILAADTQRQVIPSSVTDAIRGIHYYLCENIRTARRYISSLKIHDSIDSLHFEVLNKDTTVGSLPQLFAPILEGNHIGVLSESGCPGVADPGALAVAYAHDHGIRVVPLVGPSSVLLALMASGLNGQRFAFHGYLPIDSKDAASTIKDLEGESREKNQTQIFIETPYRNNALMNHLLKSLQPETRLCVAINLSSPTEKISCLKIREWKKQIPSLEKEPAIFLFLASA
jgi:16S rRNA (cytidine1402-2'-O)-methyltransferase